MARPSGTREVRVYGPYAHRLQFRIVVVDERGAKSSFFYATETEAKQVKRSILRQAAANASKTLEGKKVTLRPGVVPGEPMVPIAWICHNVPVPNGMEVQGANQTNVEMKYLPVECRGAAKK